MQKLKKVLLITIAITIVLIVSAFFVGKIIQGKVNHYYEHIYPNMSNLEVRQLLNGSFYETDVSIVQIENDGWSLGHLVTIEHDYYAKKYAYRFFKSLYIYVVYDGNDRVQLIVPAFE